MSDEPETMSAPIAPDDTAGLTTILDNAITWAEDANIGVKAARAYGANAVAVAVCPPGYVVVSRADLEDVVSIADEADVYIDRRLAALNRMWELLRGEQG